MNPRDQVRVLPGQPELGKAELVQRTKMDGETKKAGSHHLSNLITFSGLELFDSAFILRASSQWPSTHSNWPEVPLEKNSRVFDAPDMFASNVSLRTLQIDRLGFRSKTKFLAAAASQPSPSQCWELFILPKTRLRFFRNLYYLQRKMPGTASQLCSKQHLYDIFGCSQTTFWHDNFSKRKQILPPNLSLAINLATWAAFKFLPPTNFIFFS